MATKPRKKIENVRKHLAKMVRSDPLFQGEVALTCIDHLTDEQCKEVFKDLQNSDWEYAIDGLAKYTL